MKVYNHLDEFEHVVNPVVTIGTFDGVHLGHQKIIKRLLENARDHGGETILLSFFPHPRIVLNPDNKDLKLINTLDEKLSLLEKSGLDHVIVHPFSREFSETSSEKFIQEILVDKLKTNKLVIGYNHHFGKDRKGSFEELKRDGRRFGFEVEEIPAQDLKDIHISSTKIRKALQEGEVTLANQFLGYRFFIRGTVVKGEQRGRSLNFPTANVYIEEKYKMIPANGVYAVEVMVSGINYRGMLNIGNRPTFPGKDFSIEVHILNFEGNIYGETIEISFIERIRDEIKFENSSALESQLLKDRETVKSIAK